MLFPALTSSEAAALEQIIGAGLIHLTNARAGTITVLRKARDGRAGRNWIETNEADLAHTDRLIATARRMQSAAHRQCEAARRAECIAVRVIHAFAIAAMAGTRFQKAA